MTAKALASSNDDNVLGQNESGAKVFLKSGRFGPYVQLGEITEDNEKPRRTSIPKGFDISNVTLDLALSLLELPKVLGVHPEETEPIHSSIGPYGPYLRHNNSYANVPNLEEFLSIGMNLSLIHI